REGTGRHAGQGQGHLPPLPVRQALPGRRGDPGEEGLQGQGAQAWLRRVAQSGLPKGEGLSRVAIGLSMTGNYTHTRPETQRPQIEQALRRWPAALGYAMERVGGGDGSGASPAG